MISVLEVPQTALFAGTKMCRVGGAVTNSVISTLIMMVITYDHITEVQTDNINFHG